MEQNSAFPFWAGAVLVLVVLVGGYFYVSSRGPSPVTQTQNSQGQGKVYMTVSDASANMQNVSDVAMTVDKVELHSATQGWVTVSDSPHTFNLLSLKANGKAELAGDATVAADSYDQVRATVSKVEVKTKNAGTKGAVLVSNTLTIPGMVVVRANESSQANLDVKTSNSLHVAAKGEYVFAPVVAFESRHSANVQVQSDNSVVVSGGTVDTSSMIGTDLSGKSYVGSELPANIKIQIVGDVPVTVTGSATSSASGSAQTDSSSYMQVTGSTNGTVNLGN
ncbi:MAG: DUF4382 domain-containing protein [Minisyncoccota bacterium]